MIRHVYISILFFFAYSFLKAETLTKEPKPKAKREVIKTNFQLGAGLNGSVLYLSRNIKEDNDALGYTFVANYGGQNYLRLNLQYTYYKPINIEPTWYTIQANSIETNIEILARFNNNVTLLYPFVGVSYNTFKGYFTGMDDYLNLKEHYKSNSTIRNRWIGINIGTGLEHTFGPIVLFIDYRMRLGKADNLGSFNIMDVCYGGGVRVKISVPKSKHTHKKRFGSDNRYKLI